MATTFGDFLRPAGEHIAAAVSIRDELPAEATFGVIRQFGRLLSTLVHYLDDRPVPDEFEAAMAAEPLSPEEQTVLTRLSVFSGGFDLCAAQAVAFTDAIEPVDVLDIVSRLVSKSLVVAEARDGTTRYRLLETVRDFAWELSLIHI